MASAAIAPIFCWRDWVAAHWRQSTHSPATKPSPQRACRTLIMNSSGQKTKVARRGVPGTGTPLELQVNHRVIWLVNHLVDSGSILVQSIALVEQLLNLLGEIVRDDSDVLLH